MYAIVLFCMDLLEMEACRISCDMELHPSILLVESCVYCILSCAVYGKKNHMSPFSLVPFCEVTLLFHLYLSRCDIHFLSLELSRIRTVPLHGNRNEIWLLTDSCHAIFSPHWTILSCWFTLL